MKFFKKLISLIATISMIATILPMSVLAAEKTKAVKEDIDWENWLMPGAEFSSYLDGATYYVDDKTNIYNDYGWWCGGANPWTLTINDVGHSDTTNSIARKTYIGNESTGASEIGDIPTSDGVLWGFKGSRYYTGFLSDNSVRANFPADRWLGVKDISESEDTGFAVFTIDAVAGDTANAYLAIKVATDPWMIGLNSYEDLPVTKEAYSDRLNWVEPYMTFVLGAKLTDYYDVAKGGKQTVAVPLSKLTGSPDFKEIYAKSTSMKPSEFANKLANFPVDLRLFSGMGIAKKDSGKKQSFTAVVSDLAIVDPKAPTNLNVEQSGNKATITFDLTTDTDVTYKVRKYCDGTVEYIDAPDGILEDEIDPSKSYTYHAVAVDNTFGVMSKISGDVPEPEPEPEPEPTPDEEQYIPTVSTPDTPLYLFRDTVEGYKVYTPVGAKNDDIVNNVPSYATGYGADLSDTLVEGYWATSGVLGGTNWFNDYCVQYDELTGNGWDGKVTSPIRYPNSTPDESNKVIALQPTYDERGQLCVLNLTKNLGDADEFIYSVDVRNFFTGNVNPVAGIRVADPTDDTSYYELALISKGETYNVDHEGAKFEKPRFTKVEGGSRHTTAQAASGSEPAEWKYVDYGNVGTASGMYKNDGYRTSWFTLTIAKKGNTIYWSILDKAFNEVVWEDSYTDNSPLFDGIGVPQLFAYSAGKLQAPTFFDNIDIKKLGTKLFKYEDVAGVFKDDFQNNAAGTVPEGYSSSDAAFKVNYDKLNANAWGGESDTDVTDSNVLWLDGAGKLDYTKNVGNHYSVDLRNYFNGETNPVTGIRILDPDNSANYYELALLSGKGVYNTFADGKLYPPRFTKVQGAKSDTPAISEVAPSEVCYIENGAEKTASALVAELTQGIGHSTYWFNLELGKVGNDISLKVTDKSTGGILWSKTWTDESPLFEGAGKLQIFTYGGYGKALIDNVECTVMGDSGLRIEASWVKESTGAPMMMTADYDAEGRLLSVEDIVAPSGNKGYYFSPKSITLDGALKKLFIWDEESYKPAVATAQYQEGDISECNVTYPNFSTKAFTVSLDDGNTSYDSPVIAIMKKYGIKGTFNLTGSQWTSYEEYIHDNFEIANHTTHIEMHTDGATYEDCVASIDDGHSLIKGYTGGVECEGVIWPYRAPKNQVYWYDLYDYVCSKYEYARETGETYGFSAPLDWMQWTCTAWSDNWRTYTDKFMATEPTKELQMLALAGHAFDEPAGETSMASLCEYVFSTIASDSTIWKATNIELCKYIKATKLLEISSKNVYNPSKDTAVYMLIDGEEYVAQPQSYAVPIN